MVGIFDEAAAFGTEVSPSVTLYLQVPAIRPALERVEAAGGSAGEAAQDMGDLYSVMCTDDQGTAFGLISESLD
jgi:predicted enzyme related to lactoylglutathione lyase